MKITFLGATHEVTGSCTMIEIGQYHLLVDCGMEQGKDIFVNQKIPVPPSQIDCVLLTHAHIDHSGKLPLLVKEGFHGQIYATEATCNLATVMLKDSAHIQEFEAEWKNRKAERSGEPAVEPMYTVVDAEETAKHFVPFPYDKTVSILEGVDIRFRDAGHLLGSAMIEIWLTEGSTTKKIVFSGDIGNKNKPILKNPTQIEDADYLVMESTYGDRYHETHASEEVYITQLASCIQKTFDRGGNVVIPSFAVGRTQELLFFLRAIKERKLIRGHQDFKVYVDSPLANEATDIFLQCDHNYFDEEMQEILNEGRNPIFFPGLSVAVSSDESRAINFDPEPKVILSASGMCEAGRVRHHLKHNLWRKESTILFAGYQALGTLGRAIYEGAEKVKLFGEEIEINAQIDYLAGISGHADRAALLDWVDGFTKKPEIIFVNHGEDSVSTAFAVTLEEEHGIPVAVAPYSGTVYDLVTGECICKTEGIPVPEKEGFVVHSKSASIYNALIAAGQRLMGVIKNFGGRPNKEVKQFTREIEILCRKWED